MEPDEVGAIPSCTRVHRLHPIEEDDLEDVETTLEPADQAPSEDKSQEHVEERANGEGQESGLTGAVHSSRSIVASMKKVLSSLGPNAASSIPDFIHINDCLKESSEKNPDQTEAIVSDLNIHLLMVRGGVPDPQLQAELRNRLRLLENDNKEVAAVFCELSARLLAIESDKDVITVTFRTFEEIWKFSTYYSLGFLNHCMENIFLDQSFWLTSPEEDDVGIQVVLNEGSLSHIYRSLLMEEGMYFVLCSDNSIQQAVVVDGAVQIIQSSAGPADGPSPAWTEMDSSTSDDSTLRPRTIMEPLCPFHQWFLKKNIGSYVMADSGQKNQIVSTGWVEATVSHDSDVPDELSYQGGDMIEIITTYIQCMEWFVGKNLSTGGVGFVKTCNVKPYVPEKGQKSTDFPIDNSDLSRKSTEEDFDFEAAKILLQKMSQSDVCHLYTLDQFEETETCQNKENVPGTSSKDINNLKEKLETFLSMSASGTHCLDTSSDLQNTSFVPFQTQSSLDKYKSLTVQDTISIPSQIQTPLDEYENSTVHDKNSLPSHVQTPLDGHEDPIVQDTISLPSQIQTPPDEYEDPTFQDKNCLPSQIKTPLDECEDPTFKDKNSLPSQIQTTLDEYDDPTVQDNNSLPIQVQDHNPLDEYEGSTFQDNNFLPSHVQAPLDKHEDSTVQDTISLPSQIQTPPDEYEDPTCQDNNSLPSEVQDHSPFDKYLDPTFQDKNFLPSHVQAPLDEYEDPTFCICVEEENHDSLQRLLSFLNREQYQPSFRKLYDVSYTFLQATFHGYDEEEELVRYLSVARGAAKKYCMKWAQARICFLLGRLCTKKNKFSQARVYFEEAMGVINGDFSDIFLFTAVHMNLNAIYLKQKSKDKSCQMIEKSSSLLLGLQNYISSSNVEATILKYAMTKAILSQDQKSEIRVCQLLAKTFIDLRQHNESLPFIERLQVLDNSMDSSKRSSSGYYFQLANIYTKKCLPHLTLSCIKVASQASCTIMDSLRQIRFIVENTSKPCGVKKLKQIFPSQIAYHLRHALKSVVTDQDQELCCFIYLRLSDMCSSHRLYREARSYIMKAMDTFPMDMKYRVDILVSLTWLYMLDGQKTIALDILNWVVSFSDCTQHQLGIAHNLIGIALRGEGKIEEAARHYCTALKISREMDNLQNQAAVLANFGMLFLHLKARILVEVFLVKSVTLYSGLPIMENGANFIYVLLMLGRHYIAGDHKERGRSYYEWALLVALETNHLEGQLCAVQLLCHFYKALEVNEAQCIIYNEYQLSLAKKMADKVLEGQVLETISQLYLSLGTERACRSALEYTKRSLGIFIDLQSKEREAYAWLMAGKIYYILGQNELVDLYIQVAQNVALCTGDPQLCMQLYEASGDIFFNGASDRNKATTFYRDCALPLAVKTENVAAELRLCNKLSEILISMKNYEEALEHAKMALALSVNLENQLNERVSYHRLAGIYSHLNQSELAEHFYLKALSLCSSPLELEEESVYYMKVYLVLGDIIFYDLKDPYDAAGYYHLALAAAMDLGNKKSQLRIYTQLAVIYHNFLVDREKSLYYYQKARTFATELNVRRINLSPGQQNLNQARTHSY